MKNNDEMFKNLENALNVAQASIQVAQESLGKLAIDKETNNDISLMINAFRNGNDSMENVIKDILKKNEDKLKDLEDVDGSK